MNISSLTERRKLLRYREEDSAVSDKERLAVTDESIQSGAMQE